MRLQQSAQLHWVGPQAQLRPIHGCSTCTSPCSVGTTLATAVATTSALPTTFLNVGGQLNPPASGQPVAVTIELESRALNRYAALVFGLPLVALFALAALGGSNPISSPAQVPIILLVVAALLLIVTTLCRCVARRFESQLQLEIRH